MSDTFHKFLFLGVMIVLVVFANHGTVAKQEPLKLTYGTPDEETTIKAPPMFVLQSPAAISSNNIAADIPASQPRPDDNQAQSALLESSADSSQSVFLKRGSDPAPGILARIALVEDFKSGSQYVNLKAEDSWPLASITKLMTAVVAAGKMDLDQKVTVTNEDFAVDPSEQLLKIGDSYSISDLLKVMLLPSSNVAAEAVARAYPATAEASGRARFIADMNAQAAAWGMVNTHFDDPSGISVSSKSTAHDLFILAKDIYAGYPQIFTTTKTVSVYVTELNSGKRALVKNINNFAGQANFIGGKTGRTEEAGENLLSVFSYGQRPLFVVVMGSGDRFGDTTKLLDWFRVNYK